MGLIRLATVAIVGYAAYSILKDVMGSQGGGSGGGMLGSADRGNPGRRSQGEVGGGAMGRSPVGQITGPAGGRGGMVEQTQGSDGGSTPHRVGRGVIST